MRVKFWGVRGSIPCPGPSTVKYGGNTACIEIRFEEIGRQVIVDAGSGIRELGNHMLETAPPGRAIETEIFLTHTHWDHIMGFPFFGPIYIPETRLKVYGPVTYEDDSLEDIVGGQLSYRYFPVRQADLASRIDYVNLKEGTYDLGDGIHLTAKYLNHPILCLGYRFEYDGKSVTTVFDTEPFANIFTTDPGDPSYDEAIASEGQQAADAENQRIHEFYRGSDMVIHDMQYTMDEYLNGKKGWGHSTFEIAIPAARKLDIARIAIFHHDPRRTDDQIDALTERYCIPSNCGSMETFFARDGMVVTL